MYKILSTWFSRVLFVATMLSAIVIAGMITECYKALITEQYIEQYTKEYTRSGALSDFDVIYKQCGNYGYTVEFQVTRYNNDYEVIVQDDTIWTAGEYKLQPMDFVRVSAYKPGFIIQKTAVYRGET